MNAPLQIGHAVRIMTGASMLVDGGLTIGQRHAWDPEAPGLFDAMRALADNGADQPA